MVVSFIGRIYQHLRQRQTLSYVVSSTPMGGYYERKFENLHPTQFINLQNSDHLVCLCKTKDNAIFILM
jgi:hypothetical protein